MMQQQTGTPKLYVFMVVAMLCWSFSLIWTKIALVSFPPVTLITLRLTLASFFLFLFLKTTGKLQRIEKGDLKLFLLLAFFEPFLYYIGETYGLTMVMPTLASVIVALIPVFAPFFAFAFLKEKLSLANFIGIIISVLGVYLIVSQGSDSSSTSLKGVLLLLLAAFSAIIYGLILRKIPAKYSATTIIYYQSLLGLIYFVPSVLLIDRVKLPHIQIYGEAVAAVLMLTIFASVIAFVLFADAVRKIGIAKSQVFTNLIPVFTALFSWVLFKEILNLLQWMGVLVVVVGVFFSQKKAGTAGFLTR